MTTIDTFEMEIVEENPVLSIIHGPIIEFDEELDADENGNLICMSNKLNRLFVCLSVEIRYYDINYIIKDCESKDLIHINTDEQPFVNSVIMLISNYFKNIFSYSINIEAYIYT